MGPAPNVNKVLAALRTMHRFERLAVQAYRRQIWAFPEKEIAERLKAAMDNEQQHVDDLKVRIEELRGVTSRLGFAFHMAGGILGFSTSVLGKKVVLKADIRLEERAVKDYSAILQKVPFDDRSRVLVEKNLEDEKVHIKRWQDSLVILRTRRGEAS